MDTAAKIIYVAQAVVFTAGGIFYLQAAGSVGEGAVYWFGVDAYLWVGVASLVVGPARCVLLCFRPDLRGS